MWENDKRSQGVCCRGTRLVFPLPRDMGVEINYRSSIRVLGPGGDPVTCAITDHHWSSRIYPAKLVAKRPKRLLLTWLWGLAWCFWMLLDATGHLYETFQNTTKHNQGTTTATKLPASLWPFPLIWVPIGSGDVTCTLVIFGTGAMSANPQLSTFAQDGYGLVFVFRVSLHQAVSGGFSPCFWLAWAMFSAELCDVMYDLRFLTQQEWIDSLSVIYRGILDHVSTRILAPDN